jgi:hypothetical protein
MTFTDQEKKLATLALDAAAAKGEIDNGAAMFFRSLRNRSVKIADLANGSSASGANYEPLYQAERMTSSSLRFQVASLQDEIAKLKGELETAKTMTISRAQRGVGGKLTAKEEAMVAKLARWNDYSGQSHPTSTCWNVCKTNGENGVMSTLIKKGMVQKAWSDGHSLTEAGAEYFRTYLAS